jgi:hypothetical protein
MASNNRIRAILRLRGTIPKRQVDLLLALETFTPDDDGWREAGADLLDTETNVSPRTAARAREELTGAGWLDYERGDGRGYVSRYRVRLPDVPKKEGRQNAGVKGRQNAGSEDSRDDYMATFKGRQNDPVKVANDPDKGRHRNPATSADANGALKESALKSSASRARDVRARDGPRPPRPARPQKAGRGSPPHGKNDPNGATATASAPTAAPGASSRATGGSSPTTATHPAARATARTASPSSPCPAPGAGTPSGRCPRAGCAPPAAAAAAQGGRSRPCRPASRPARRDQPGGGGRYGPPLIRSTHP